MAVEPICDMTVLTDLDRFRLLLDTIGRLPRTGGEDIDLEQQLKAGNG